MTGRRLYTLALAQLSQAPGDNPRWDSLALPWLNLALAELLPTLNAMARFENRPEADTAPTAQSLDDPLPVSPALQAALANALVAALWQDAGEHGLAQQARARAEAQARMAVKVRPQPIQEVY